MEIFDIKRKRRCFSKFGPLFHTLLFLSACIWGIWGIFAVSLSHLRLQIFLELKKHHLRKPSEQKFRSWKRHMAKKLARMSKIVDEATLKGHNSWTTGPNYPRLCIHFAMKYFFMPLKWEKILLNYYGDIWHQAKKRHFFKNLGHYFTLCCFFMHAYRALKVGRSEALGLMDNHGYFGDKPLSILAKI